MRDVSEIHRHSRIDRGADAADLHRLAERLRQLLGERRAHGVLCEDGPRPEEEANREDEHQRQSAEQNFLEHKPLRISRNWILAAPIVTPMNFLLASRAVGDLSGDFCLGPRDRASRDGSIGKSGSSPARSNTIRTGSVTEHSTSAPRSRRSGRRPLRGPRGRRSRCSRPARNRRPAVDRPRPIASSSARRRPSADAATHPAGERQHQDPLAPFLRNAKGPRLIVPALSRLLNPWK